MSAPYHVAVANTLQLSRKTALFTPDIAFQPDHAGHYCAIDG